MEEIRPPLAGAGGGGVRGPAVRREGIWVKVGWLLLVMTAQLMGAGMADGRPVPAFVHERGESRELGLQERNRLWLEAQQRVVAEFGRQGIAVLAYSAPQFVVEGSRLTIQFRIELALGQPASTGNSAQVSLQYESVGGVWRFLRLATLCCGEH